MLEAFAPEQAGWWALVLWWQEQESSSLWAVRRVTTQGCDPPQPPIAPRRKVPFHSLSRTSIFPLPSHWNVCFLLLFPHWTDLKNSVFWDFPQLSKIYFHTQSQNFSLVMNTLKLLFWGRVKSQRVNSKWLKLHWVFVGSGGLHACFFFFFHKMLSLSGVLANLMSNIL